MNSSRRLTRWLVALALLHLVVACAGFFAPYDPTEQNRDTPYLPPTRIHWIDAQGHLHFRPFFYGYLAREDSLETLREDTTQLRPVRCFVKGARYHLLGFLPSEMHLFGAASQRIHLLGTDAYGRDQFSRVLYGGQLSLLAGLLGTSLTLLLG